MPKTTSLAVVMDPIAKIKFAKDSTLAMLLAAATRGWKLTYFEQSDLYLRDGVALGRGRDLHGAVLHANGGCVPGYGLAFEVKDKLLQAVEIRANSRQMPERSNQRVGFGGVRCYGLAQFAGNFGDLQAPQDAAVVIDIGLQHIIHVGSGQPLEPVQTRVLLTSGQPILLATRSMTSNPMLCRVARYSDPGLPKPTTSFMA